MPDVIDLVPGEGRDSYEGPYLSILTDSKTVHLLMPSWRDFEIWYNGLRMFLPHKVCANRTIHPCLVADWLIFEQLQAEKLEDAPVSFGSSSSSSSSNNNPEEVEH